MNKLDELIEKLCPNGIKYYTLDNVCSINTGTQLNKSKLLDNAEYPVINGGIVPSGYWYEYNTNKDTIIISQGGASAGYVNFMEMPFWAGAHCYIVKKESDEIIYRYLYHFLKGKETILQQCQQGAGIPSLSKNAIYELAIPIPPLEIQSKVVNILDNFTDLSKNLIKELKNRQRQYEYYRDKLINKNNKNAILSDIVKIKNGKDYKSYGNGNIPVYGSGGIIAYTSKYAYEKASVLIPRKGSINKLYYVETPFWNVDTIFYTEINTELAIPKYIYYCLECEHLEKLNVASGVPSLTQKVLNNVKLYIPTLDEQSKIVNRLDKLYNLINSISEGLPAEIETRQKQYEYYRNKLLTFDKLTYLE